MATAEQRLTSRLFGASASQRAADDAGSLEHVDDSEVRVHRGIR